MRIVRRSTLIFLLVISALTALALAVIGASLWPQGAWLGLAAPVVVLGWGLRKSLARLRASRKPFPEAHRAWLLRHVPFYRHLDDEGRARFERDVRLFIADQTFEAVDGVAITDRLLLEVAAGAALMLHGRPDWAFSTSRSFLFYPDHFDEDYYDTREANYEGMVHAQGPVILSVKAMETGWAASADGNNVVLHELAHLLDYDNSFADGVPSLMDPASAAAWIRLVHREMHRVKTGRSLLRRYAATNPAEFFAVAVENFFERPHKMARRHPKLFEALMAFFNLDPRTPEPEPQP
jgi:Mlc titration factor MtfA (ptsG expression regulator)